MSFKLTPGLGRQITNELNQLAELPFEGFLAGGAVANFILMRAWGRELPINDLDIFVVEKMARGNRKKAVATAIEATETDDYTGMPLQRSVSNNLQLFVGFERDGMLNTITVQMDEEDRGRQLSGLLKGFDLNACQAGIDLKSSELVWTPEFEKFIQTRQLEVCFPGTPYQTTVRLVKKVIELGCYCDIEAETRCLATCVDFGYREREERVESGSLDKHFGYKRWFSEKHFEVYEKYADDLEPLVDLVVFDPKDVPENGAEINTEDFKPLWSFNFKQPSERDEVRGILGLEDKELSVLEAKKAWDLLLRPTVSFANRRRAKTILSDPRALNMVSAGIITIEKDFHEKHIGEFFSFLEKHTRLTGLLSRKDRDFVDLFAEYKLIRAAAKRHGEWVIGGLENTAAHVYMADNFEVTPESIDKLAEKMLSEVSDDPLVNPLNLEDFPAKDQVRELITSRELMEEGNRMHHCVGGYASSLIHNGSRIFHISGSSAKGSTLEIKLHPRNLYGHKVLQDIGKIHCGQHLTVQNKKPAEDEEVVVEELIEYLSNKYGAALVRSQLKELASNKRREIRQNVRAAFMGARNALTTLLALTFMLIKNAPKALFGAGDYPELKKLPKKNRSVAWDSGDDFCAEVAVEAEDDGIPF